MAEVKNLTIRLTPEEYSHAKGLADEQQISLNQLIKEGIKLLEAQAKQKQLFDDFTELGEDFEGSDVELAIEAQNESSL